MEQHPVPSQISSYQFRLVGDMTLKQFLQVAGGAIVGLLTYSSGLPALIKWPLIIFFLSFGAALAFLPFQERPLEEWILAFFRSVYQPTLYTWQKASQPQVYFASEPQIGSGQGVVDNSPSDKTADTIKHKGVLGKLEEAEQSFLQKVTQMSAASVTTATPVASSLDVRGPVSQNINPTTQTNTNLGANNPIKPAVTIPETGTVRMEPRRVVEPLPQDGGQVGGKGEVYSVDQILSGQASVVAQQARFSQHAAPPEPPSEMNTVVGQVMDSEGRIIEGAILEVRDEGGRPVRALRTNKAGHFRIVTQLLAGKYQVVIEKDGQEFEAVTFEVNNQIVPPIAIRAK